MLSRRSVGTYQRNELTRNSSGNIRLRSSQLAEPLWTYSGLRSAISGQLVMLSRHCGGIWQGNELTRNSSGNARPQSSQLAEPPWIELLWN